MVTGMIDFAKIRCWMDKTVEEALALEWVWAILN
jgi:hypothetical protein